VVVLHQEVERIAVLTAAKTMIKALARAYGERRRFLIVKRTACFVFFTRFLELDAAANNLNDIRPVDEVNNELLGYKSAHSVTNGHRALSGLLNSIIANRSLLLLFKATCSELQA
jgi:hypothetical protein